MGLDSPQTYAEFYWAMQLEAANLYDENVEKAFSNFFGGLFVDIPAIADLPSGIQTFVRTLASPPSAGFGGFALGVGIETIDEVLHNAMSPLMKMMSRAINKRSKETWLTSEQANTLFSRGKITQPLWNEIVTSEGYEDILGKFLYMAQKPYPTIPDIMRWARYKTDPYNIRTTVIDKFDVDNDDFELWQWLSGMRLTIAEVQNLYKREIFSESQFNQNLAQIGYDKDDLPLLKNLSYSIPNAMLLLQGDLFKGTPEAEIIKHVTMGDVHPDFASTYIDAVLTKPSATDLIAYQLRFDPNLNNLSQELRKIGIHTHYHNMYKELAYQIPPVADIITMAVREAFTPAIATKFGQYEDLPAEYVKYVGMKGLSKEWAERYWAAHWNLPSPMQGFEMLHRGIITKDELIMLLRALDVMPFWRDKLIQLAYNVYNRIDIRRMYALGILDRDGVYKSYLENGYDETKSKQLTEFTVRQQIASLTGFSSKSIISAYSKGLINSSQAVSMLNNIRVPATDINEIMQAANYKKEWEIKSLQIESTEHLYKNKTITESAARSNLSSLGIASNEIELMLNKWKLAVKIIRIATWTTAQTLSLFKRGIITQPRARNELAMLDFDKEHIDALILNAQATL